MIAIKTFDTILGSMTGGSTEEGICLLEYTDSKRQGTAYRILTRYLECEPEEGSNELLVQLESELNDYFSGSLKKFSVPLVFTGTDFQKSVWNELLQIPYGKTSSYLEQAAALGNAGSVRAVANANGMNRIAIIVPCHRVIGADGRLTGYGGGLWRKRWLLEHEKKFSGQPVSQLLFKTK